MAPMSVIIPCASLGAIIGVMLVFFWWWFPRAWKHGSKSESEEIAMELEARGDDGLTQKERMEIAGQHAKAYIQAIEARNKARAEGREYEGPPPVYEPFGRTYNPPPPTA